MSLKLCVFLGFVALTALCLPAACDLTASIVAIDTCNRPFLQFQASFREFVPPGSSLFVTYEAEGDAQPHKESQYVVSQPGIYPGQIVSFPSCRVLPSRRKVCVDPEFGFLLAPKNQSTIHLALGGGKSSNGFGVAMGASLPPVGMGRGVHFEGDNSLAQLKQTSRFSCLPTQGRNMSADDLLERCSNVDNWIEEPCSFKSFVWNSDLGVARSDWNIPDYSDSALLYAPYISFCPDPEGGILLAMTNYFNPNTVFYLSFVDVVNITFRVTRGEFDAPEVLFPNGIEIINPPNYRERMKSVDYDNFNLFVSSYGFDDRAYSFSVAVTDDASSVHRMSAQTVILAGPDYQGMRSFTCVMGFADCIRKENWKARICRAPVSGDEA